MEIPEQEIATTDAAKLVLSAMRRVLSETSSDKKQIASSLTPVFGIRWDAQIAHKVISTRLCSILCSLRNSKLDKTNYHRIVSLWKLAHEAEPTFSASLGDGEA